MSFNRGEISLENSSFVDIDALIKEARQHQRRRWNIIGVSMVSLALSATGLITILGGRSNLPPVTSTQLSRGPSSASTPLSESRNVNATINVPGLDVPQPDGNQDTIASGVGSFWALSTVLTQQRDCAGAGTRVTSSAGTSCLYNYVVRISPTADRVIAQIPVQGHWDLAYGDGAVWVASSKVFGYSYYLYEIDPITDRIERTVTIPSTEMLDPSGDIGAIAVGNGDVFFLHDNGSGRSVDVVNAVMGSLIAEWPVPDRCAPMTQVYAAINLVWVGACGLDVTSGAIQYTMKLPSGFSVNFYTLTRANLWVAGTTSNVGPDPLVGGPHRILFAIDPATGTVLRELDDGAIAVTSSDGNVWVAEGYEVATPASMSPTWTTKSNSEFYGELSFAKIKPTTGYTQRRIFEPQIGGGNFWLCFAADRNYLALEDGAHLTLMVKA